MLRSPCRASLTLDPVGLERTFRFFQAVCQIIASYPAVFGIFLTLLDFGSAKPHQAAETLSVVLGLRQRFNLARRFFRFFRFLQSFSAARKILAAISPSGRASAKKKISQDPIEAWLDVLAHTFNGMYLLLDAPAIIADLRIEGFQVLSPEWDRKLMIEAQRFWLFALACGALSSFLKRQKLRAPAPKKVVGSSDINEKTQTAVATSTKEDEAVAKIEEQARAKKRSGLARNAVANALDIILPGAMLGWINASPGTVGLAMLVTTILTGKDAWDRCGREVSG